MSSLPNPHEEQNHEHTSKEKDMKIEFGVFAPPLHEQLGISEKEGEVLEKLDLAISTLSVHRIITQTDTHKARLRLVKKIERTMKEIKP